MGKSEYARSSIFGVRKPISDVETPKTSTSESAGRLSARILHWIDIFLPRFTTVATRKSGLGQKSLEGSVDPRACGCRGVMPPSRQFLSTKVYPFKYQGGEECSNSLTSLTRSRVSSVGRASDLQAEGCGFESYTG